MGTRGAVGFYSQGVEKVSYNHYDSYPRALGERVIEYISESGYDSKVIKDDFDAIKVVKPSGKPTSPYIRRVKAVGFIDPGQDYENQDWYDLLRPAQGDLQMYATLGVMPDCEGFLYDSLFCEWAYIINLDISKLEIYKGFQQVEGHGRYGKTKNGGYYGVTLVAEIGLELADIELMEFLENNENDKAIISNMLIERGITV